MNIKEEVADKLRELAHYRYSNELINEKQFLEELNVANELLKKVLSEKENIK